MKQIPSTQALRALESFARYGTVWEAAEELCVTRSAVSHQLRALEKEIGFALFNRVGTGIELTPQGKAYARDIAAALQMVSNSAERNADKGPSGNLKISCTPGFASMWLCTRIAQFRSTYPDINLSVVTPRRLDDITNPLADIFIAFGDGQKMDAELELLREVEFTPLLSPSLLNQLGGLSKPADIANAHLLHLTTRQDWRDWFMENRLPEEPANHGAKFSDMNLLFAAAINAQGIMLGDEFICRQAMRTGQLIRPFEQAVKSPNAYYLAIPPSKTELTSVIAFKSWLKEQLTARRA